MRPDEAGVIRMFREALGSSQEPDDIERVALGGSTLASKVDTLVYSTDVPPGMLPRQAARKSVAACVSDFAAKGVRPRWGLVSLVAPGTWERADFEETAGGVAEAAAEFGVGMIGGDTNRGEDPSITVCLLGMAGHAPYRSGASPGDQILVSGPFGLSAAGLHMLINGTGDMEGAAEAVLRPVPRLEFGARAAPLFSSSMDSSDGLSATLHEMSRRSGVAMIIEKSPAAAGLERFAGETGLDPRRLIYHGGEEYEIVFTARPSRTGQIEEMARETGTPVLRIGRVEDGAGVLIEEDGRRPLTEGGWKAFG